MAQETIPALVHEKPGNMRAVPGFSSWVLLFGFSSGFSLGSPPGFSSPLGSLTGFPQLKRTETDDRSGLHARLQRVTSMITVV
jgi:hypothetical protein